MVKFEVGASNYSIHGWPRCCHVSSSSRSLIRSLSSRPLIDPIYRVALSQIFTFLYFWYWDSAGSLPLHPRLLLQLRLTFLSSPFSLKFLSSLESFSWLGFLLLEKSGRRIWLMSPNRVRTWRLLHFENRTLNGSRSSFVSRSSFNFPPSGPMVGWITHHQVRCPSTSKIFGRIFDFRF